VHDLTEKLVPVYGASVRRLYELFSRTTSLSLKKRIEAQLKGLFIRAGLDNKLLLPPPSRDDVDGDYPIGVVTYAKKELYPFKISPKDFIHHCLVLGATGMGKTTLKNGIIYNLLSDYDKGHRFLALDFKKDARHFLQYKEFQDKLLVYTVGSDVSPISIDVLQAPPGCSRYKWHLALASVINRSFFLGEGADYIITKALQRATNIYDTPLLKDVLDEVLNVTTPERLKRANRPYEWTASAWSRLDKLKQGDIGTVFEPPFTPICWLIEHNVVLEMDGWPPNIRSFLINTILMWIGLYRQANPSKNHLLVTFIDEAHHAFNQPDKPFSEENPTLLALRE